MRKMRPSKTTDPSPTNPEVLGKRKSRKPRSFSPLDDTRVDANKVEINKRSRNTNKAVTRQKGKKVTHIKKSKSLKSSAGSKKRGRSESSDTSITEDDADTASKENLTNNGSPASENMTAAFESPRSRATSPEEELNKNLAAGNSPRSMKPGKQDSSNYSGDPFISPSTSKKSKIVPETAASKSPEIKSLSIQSSSAKRSKQVPHTPEEKSINNSEESRDSFESSDENSPMDNSSDRKAVTSQKGKRATQQYTPPKSSAGSKKRGRRESHTTRSRENDADTASKGNLTNNGCPASQDTMASFKSPQSKASNPEQKLVKNRVAGESPRSIKLCEHDPNNDSDDSHTSSSTSKQTKGVPKTAASKSPNIESPSLESSKSVKKSKRVPQSPDEKSVHNSEDSSSSLENNNNDSPKRDPSVRKDNNYVSNEQASDNDSMGTGEEAMQPKDLDSTSKNHDDTPETDEDDEDQLFGENYIGEKMILLQDGIYCENSVYKYSVGSSHRATHVARKLLEGVFKHEALMKCTVTGQAARAHGNGRQTRMPALHEDGREEIIGFAKKMAERRQWIEQDDKTIKKAMAQKMVELKQMARKNAA